MKLKNHALVVTISLMIIGMSLGQYQVSAAVVWSDDFSDGDYDGWTVHNGTWSASSNALIATNGEGQHNLSNIYFPSNVNYGNFSFDFFQDSTVSGHYYVFVHGNDMRETGVLNVLPYFGIVLQFFDSAISIIRSYNNQGTTLEGYTHTESFDGWYQIDMIVMSNHSIHVYLDKELVIETTSLTVFDESECFMVIAPDNGGIDNVVVDAEDVTTGTDTSETTDTTTDPSTTPTQPETPLFDSTTVLIIAAGGIGVVIIAIVILKKR
jgi:hypothetical protein